MFSAFIISCGDSSSNSNRRTSSQNEVKKGQTDKTENNFSDELKSFVSEALSEKTSKNYNYIKIIAECGDNPDPESSSLVRNLWCNNNIEILFDKNLNILNIEDTEDYLTIGEQIKLKIKDGEELSPWDEMNEGSREYNSRNTFDWGDIWKDNEDIFKEIADNQDTLTWNNYSGQNKKYVQFLDGYYDQIKKNEDVLCAWCYSFQINEIHLIKELNVRMCSNDGFLIYENAIEANNQKLKFDFIKYLDNKICIYLNENQYQIFSSDGKNLTFPKGTDVENNLIYNDGFEFFFPLEGTENGSYSIYKFNRPRPTILNDLSAIEGEYMGGGSQRTTTSRKVWKETLSIEQNMILYGPNAWATDENFTRSEWVDRILNEQKWDIGIATYDILSLENEEEIKSEKINGESDFDVAVTNKEKLIFATSKVSNLNVRSTPEISDNIIGRLQLKQTVQVIDTVRVKIPIVTHALLNKETFINIDGSKIPFKSGVAVQLIEEVSTNNYRVLISDKQKEVIISKSYLDMIDEEVWIKIKLTDNVNGYVYKKFLE